MYFSETRGWFLLLKQLSCAIVLRMKYKFYFENELLQRCEKKVGNRRLLITLKRAEWFMDE